MGLVEELTKLSIRNGSIYAGLTRDIRVTDPLDNHDKVWRGNLACNIIEKAKSYNHQKNLEIFYLDQLLNNNNSKLITWQQLKKAWSKSAKEKKARWFAEIEKQTLLNNASRLVKNKFRLDKKIQQTVHLPLFKHKKDKRNKDWIIFEDQR
ncbi:33581_t:CDS:2, partial [Gigaspora margarita]